MFKYTKKSVITKIVKEIKNAKKSLQRSISLLDENDFPPEEINKAISSIDIFLNRHKSNS